MFNTNSKPSPWFPAFFVHVAEQSKFSSSDLCTKPAFTLHKSQSHITMVSLASSDLWWQTWPSVGFTDLEHCTRIVLLEHWILHTPAQTRLSKHLSGSEQFSSFGSFYCLLFNFCVVSVLVCTGIQLFYSTQRKVNFNDQLMSEVL